MKRAIFCLVTVLAATAIAAHPAMAKKHGHKAHKKAAAAADPDAPPPVHHASHGAWPSPAGGESTSGGPELVLTFDDGPSPKTTPLVLDTLEQHHLQAVFFLVGERIEGSPTRAKEIIDRELKDGDVIGNHSMNHKDLCRSTREVAEAQIDLNAAILKRVVPLPIAWFRVPYGSYCTQIKELLDARGLTHFHWDIDAQEWKHNDAIKAQTFIIEALRHLNGRGVLLMHDTKVATTKALPVILDWLDGENARRKQTGEKPIRVVSPSELATERLAPGIAEFMGEVHQTVATIGGSFASLVP